MEYFAVQGGVPLEGCVAVHGAKNSALPILAATLLAPGEHVLHNCPDLTDIAAALAILSCLGCQVRREGSTVVVNTIHRRGCAVPDRLMGQMRASVRFLGSLLASSGEAIACCNRLAKKTIDSDLPLPCVCQKTPPRPSVSAARSVESTALRTA